MVAPSERRSRNPRDPWFATLISFAVYPLAGQHLGMNISKATRQDQQWLGQQIEVVQPDLKLKHRKMAESVFQFFRATFYRWAQVWGEVCPDHATAPKVIAVGDLHIENFGTWRDAEGRLIWGVNDFDECFLLAYTNDLIRLVTKRIPGDRGEPTRRSTKRGRGSGSQRVPGGFKVPWQAVRPCRHTHAAAGNGPLSAKRSGEVLDAFGAAAESEERGKSAAKALLDALPERGLRMRVVHRIAGLGSLGRQRYVALADWRGAKIAREIKAKAPSACVWAGRLKQGVTDYPQQALKRAVRCPDPFLSVTDQWVVRRLSPDCSRIELSDLPD